MESAIKNLRNLCLGQTEGNSESVAKSTPDSETGILLLTLTLCSDEIYLHEGYMLFQCYKLV